MKRFASAFAASVLGAILVFSGMQASPAAAASGDKVLIGTPLSAKKGIVKGNPPRPGQISTLAACTGTCYNYEVGSQGGTTPINKNGVFSYVRIGGHVNALNAATDSHTLGEIAVQSSTGGQTIEFGWITAPALNGTSVPRPFVFTWVNGVPGAYNGNGFVSASGAPVIPGTTNLTPGDVVSMAIWHNDSLNRWEFEWNGALVGWYPDSRWSSASPPVTFKKMQVLQLYGEIASSETTPCSDMGLGYPSTDATNAARFSGVNFIDASHVYDATTPNLTVYSDPSATAGAPYGGTTPIISSGLTRGFRYGGPMWNAAGTAVGTRAAC